MTWMRANGPDAEAGTRRTPGGTVIGSDGVGVFLGLDVGKHAHHGHGLTPAGKKIFDKPLPNSEPKLRAVFDKLKAKFGTVLVIVDQPASIRTMPHTLRTLDLTDEVTAELTMLVGFDQDLAGEANRTSNRIRGLLTRFHPSLERVPGLRLDHQAVTSLLERHGSPQALRKAGRRRLIDVVRPRAPRMAERLVDDIFDALDEQTVVVPGTGTLDVIVPSLPSRWPPSTNNAGPWRPGSRPCWRPTLFLRS